MTDYKNGMGQRIKYKRKEIGMTQEELAENLGISVKHLSETERGLTGLSIENLIKLCDLFGVTLDYLIRGEEKNNTKWDVLLPMLNGVCSEKKEELYQLIRLGINLTK